MKQYINSMMVVLSLAYIPLMHGSSYEDPSDYAVVNDIKKKSNLTEDYVNQMKFLWLGPLQDIAAGGIGAYATYKMGAATSILADAMITKIGTPKYQQGMLSNKWLWALAGATGMGFGAYKVLYPRLEKGILKHLQAYIALCENLDVVKNPYTTELNLNTMGTSAGNSAWVASNIARLKGVENLLYQAGCALKLLDRLTNSDEIQKLRTKIVIIQRSLDNNLRVIKQAANRELTERHSQISRNVGFEQQFANLNLVREQASALKVGKISLAVTALSSFFKSGMESLVYINDNKEKIISGAAMVGLAGYALVSYMKSKLSGILDSVSVSK
ncbi:MAG TPA: hypothetical protein VLB80_04430 [Candidatus Babeliales bacterium]|nr:hypothetical protein [Candidatus Babeliales bacterium]